MWSITWPFKGLFTNPAQGGKTKQRAFLEQWIGLQMGAWALLVSLVALSDYYQPALSPVDNMVAWSDRPVSLLAFLVLAVAGVGLVEWRGLKQYLPQANWWLPATVGGTLLGFGLAQLFPAPRPEGVLFLMAFFTAVFQAGVLAPAGRQVSWWLPVKAVGLLLSPYNLWLAGWLWAMTVWLAEMGIMGLMVFQYLLVGLPFALVTGLFLAWFLFPESRPESE